MVRKKIFGHNAAVALGHQYSGKTRDPGERGGMPSKSVRSKNYKASKPSELPLEVAMSHKALFNKYQKNRNKHLKSLGQRKDKMVHDIKKSFGAY